MNKHFIRGIIGMCVAAMVMLHLPFAVSAASPTDAYTHWEGVDGTTQTVFSRDLYEATREIHATSLGIKKLSGITDVHCTNDGTVYLLCGEYSRLVVLNSDYEFIKEVEVNDETGFTYDFTGAQGIFVSETGKIFIADTMYGRVLITDLDGVLIEELYLPESDIIPEEFFYQPMKVLEDDLGYLYVLSLGSYHGTILYSPEHEFLGFYGSNQVESTVLDTLSYIWELLTSNDEKKSQQEKVLPFTIIDLAIDSEGYIYTCTGSTGHDVVGSGQIRKISPGGTNVLYKREFDGTASDSSGNNFLENAIVKRLGYNRVQNLVALDISASGNMYVLDGTYGKIYVYDEDCNLLSSFGGGVGSGVQLGTFNTPIAMAVNGNDIIVADSKKCSLTVFELTDFGSTLIEAEELYFDGKYIEAKPYWEQILAEDSNNRLAYKGIAKAYYTEENLEAALKYAKLGMDYVTYDEAHQAQITRFMQKHFVVLFVALIIVIVAIVILLLKIRKRETPLIRNIKLHTMASVILHPFVAFHDIKYKKYGSMPIAIVLTVCLFLSATLKNIASGFLFNQSDPNTYNTLFAVAQTAGLMVLWSVANWAVSTIMDGKGRIKEVYIVSVYSMIPLILYNILYVLLSHVMPLDSVDVIISLKTIILVIVFFLLSVGIMAVHEYDFKKFLLTSVIAVLLMFLIVFIGFMIVILIQQFGDFLYSLYMEVVYR